MDGVRNELVEETNFYIVNPDIDEKSVQREFLYIGNSLNI